MVKVLGALVVVLSCVACSPTVEVAPEPTPVTVPPTGPCQVSEQVPEPAGPGGPGPDVGTGPDVAPHNAENNRWKQRKSLTPAAVRSGRDTIARIVPALEPICARGDFTAATTKKALAAPDVWVEQRGTSVFFSLSVDNGQSERTTCVNGDMSPGAIRVFVQGTTGEGSCVEPKSH